MSIEVEAKFPVADPEPLRQALRRLGARAAGRLFECDRIFDTADRRLLGADCGLRIRQQHRLDPAQPAPSPPAGAWLTYKGPRVPGDIKSREELEIALTDAAVAAEILARLGFQPVVLYEKRRELWLIGGCEVALDELPRLGWWLEVEGPDAAAVHAVAAQLGLGDTPPTQQTYVEMAAMHGDPAPPGRRLAFETPPD